MNSLIRRARQTFVDTLKIKVKGGCGGTGLPQYGGIGGEGGDVYIEADQRASASLAKIASKNPTKLFVAKNGFSSRKMHLIGDKGADVVIRVPLGVSIEDENKQFVGEINKETDKICVAMGGRGGDKFNDNHGFAGQTRILKLDLKMISDVGFVGYPNAGKSTLLGAVSRAKPKVAAYPFTTLRPTIGVVEFADGRRITMTDLPGIVDGAHKNIGLGYDFLKHVSRTKLLVFVLDINNIDLGPNYQSKNPVEALSTLKSEIELFDDTILNKPSILLVSKMDSLENSQQLFTQIKNEVAKLGDCKRMVDFDRILPISVHSRLNIDAFREAAREILDEHAEKERSITSAKVNSS